MAILHPNVLDRGLQYAKTYADKVFLCRTMPTTYEEAITAPGIGNNGALGFKNLGTGGVFPDDIVDVSGVGRKIVSIPITDGEGTYDGNAAYWAVVYSTAGLLLATQEMYSSLAIQDGQTWTLAAFEIQLDYPID